MHNHNLQSTRLSLSACAWDWKHGLSHSLTLKTSAPPVARWVPAAGQQRLTWRMERPVSSGSCGADKNIKAFPLLISSRWTSAWYQKCAFRHIMLVVRQSNSQGLWTWLWKASYRFTFTSWGWKERRREDTARRMRKETVTCIKRVQRNTSFLSRLWALHPLSKTFSIVSVKSWCSQCCEPTNSQKNCRQLLIIQFVINHGIESSRRNYLELFQHP